MAITFVSLGYEIFSFLMKNKSRIVTMYSSSGQASTYIIVKDTNLGRLNQINIVQVCLVAGTLNIEHKTLKHMGLMMNIPHWPILLRSRPICRWSDHMTVILLNSRLLLLEFFEMMRLFSIVSPSWACGDSST